MNLKHNSPATKVTDTTNIFWVAAALCWQSAGCNYIGPTQTRPAFYWLQLHWGKYDILTEFRVCCSSVRMKQLQFLLSNNRGPEVFARKKTPTINCHQNDNYHDHHWDETLRTVPVASESIRFYISTYSARFTLMNMLRSQSHIIFIWQNPVQDPDYVTLTFYKHFYMNYRTMSHFSFQLSALQTYHLWTKA